MLSMILVLMIIVLVLFFGDDPVDDDDKDDADFYDSANGKNKEKRIYPKDAEQGDGDIGDVLIIVNFHAEIQVS